MSGRPAASDARAPNGSDPVTLADPRCRWLDSSRGTVSLKAWRGAGDEARAERSGRAPSPSPADAAALADLRRRGIDLDPEGHAAGHEHDAGEPGHQHPHAHAEPGE